VPQKSNIVRGTQVEAVLPARMVPQNTPARQAIQALDDHLLVPRIKQNAVYRGNTDTPDENKAH